MILWANVALGRKRDWNDIINDMLSYTAIELTYR